MKRILIWIAALQLTTGIVYAQKEKTVRLLLKNATIIDGNANVPPYKATILISNGLIEKIYSKATAPEADNAKVIDCYGKFITPGIIDAHVHFATMDIDNLMKELTRTDSILLNFVRHGVTTVRDMTGDGMFLGLLKRMSATGEIIAPDIFYAAQFASPHYFELVNNGKKEKFHNTPWYCAITNDTDIRLAIAQAKGAGVTGIKIYNDLTKEQIRKITEEAHRQGLQAWSHAAVFPAKPMDAVMASVNSISHAHDIIFEQIPGKTIETGKAWEAVYKGMKVDTAILDPLLHEMKKRDVYLDATLYHAENNKLTNAAIITRRAYESGVKIVTGTDWIYPTVNAPLPLMEEMKVMVNKCQMKMRDVLQASTMNAANVIGLHDRGVILEGKRADLLILDNNPLNGPEALFTPQIVIKNGRIQNFE